MGQKDIVLIVVSAAAMFAFLYAMDTYPQVRAFTQK